MNAIPRVAPLRRILREALMNAPNQPAASSPTEPSAALPLPASSAPLSISDGDRRVWQSTDLLGPEPEALIVHRGQTYRLRCTKQGKLILYK